MHEEPSRARRSPRSRGEGGRQRSPATDGGARAGRAAESDWSALGRVFELLATGRPLDDVLAALVRAAERDSPGARGSVLLVDERTQTLRLRAAPNLPAELGQAIDGLAVGAEEGSCAAAVRDGRRAVITDLATTPERGRLGEIALAAGVRAVWSQPIPAPDGSTVGSFAFYLDEPRPPSAEEARHLETAAHVAGIAIERERNEERRRGAEERFRRQTRVLVDLARTEQMAQATFESIAQLATETAARTLGVERTSVWLFDDDRRRLACIDMYRRTPNSHGPGPELLSADFPRYFAALDRGRTVAADDAATHPDTSEFAESYLAPNGITSMLDAPLRSGGLVIGAVCHEHVGVPRAWTKEEQEFAASVADFVTLAHEASERRRAERAAAAASERLLEMQQRERERVEAELSKVEDQLVRQTRLAAIGQIAAGIAHELRNPLGSIHNAAFYLARHVPEEQKKWVNHLRIIRDEVAAADRIISSLLGLSRAQPPTRRPIELGPVVEGAWAALDPVQTEGVRLTLDLAPRPFVVHADPDQLRQLLLNLLANAVQATGGAGRVVVQARHAGEYDELLLADDGPGIPAELCERVFEPLVTGRPRGTGLGLALCRQIAEAHDGSIDLVQAELPGAAFRVRLRRGGETCPAP